MNLIVAVDNNWGIGKDNQLLCYLPTDLKYFKSVTANKTVVYGRKTLSTFPGGKPLKNRTNIVFPTTLESKNNLTVVKSMVEMKNAIGSMDTKDVFVIGGDSIYKFLLPYCEYAYVTKIKKSFCPDTFFPNLDAKDNWELHSIVKSICDEGISATMVVYKNNSVLML